MTTLAVTERSLLHRFTEGLPRPYWFLWGGLLINRIGSFIVPMMTVYLTTQRGVSLVTAGEIVALYGVGSLIGTSAGGWLADHVGRRTTLLLSLGSSATTMLALGQAREIVSIGALVFLLGVTADLFRPASQALVADLVAPQYRVKAFGTQYWAINLGFACATLIAGFVGRNGFEVLFFADAATTLACLAFIFVGVAETRPESGAHHEGSLLTPFVDPKFSPFLVLSYVMAFVFMQHLTALPKDMTDKGLGPEAFGMALATNGILIVLLQPLVLRAVTSVHPARPLILGAILTGLGFGATALASELPHFALTVAIWTLGEIMMAPVNSTVVASRSPAHLRGRYQGAFGLTWSLAFVTAPLVGPRLVAATSMSIFWLLCLGASLLAAVGYWAMERVEPKQ